MILSVHIVDADIRINKGELALNFPITKDMENLSAAELEQYVWMIGKRLMNARFKTSTSTEYILIVPEEEMFKAIAAALPDGARGFILEKDRYLEVNVDLDSFPSPPNSPNRIEMPPDKVK